MQELVKKINQEKPVNLNPPLTYTNYLHLDILLDAQKPLSPNHNEMLFIIQHQTSELWMKLVLHELRATIVDVAKNKLDNAFKKFARIKKIMHQLIQAWDVLTTMTPVEYRAIRPYLANSSGFQSVQYRCIEFALGNKDVALTKSHAGCPKVFAQVQKALHEPSLYDQTLGLLASYGLEIPSSYVKRDWTQRYKENEKVEQAWLTVYRHPTRYSDLCHLAEKLIDLEDDFRCWRFRHINTVQRMIGFKKGTGGTRGVGYLRKMLDVVLFPELWNLRTSF